MSDPDDALNSRRVAEWDWVVLPSYGALHAPLVWDDPDYNAGCEGKTLCGRKGWLNIPGLFSRMGTKRCARCCALTGYPTGNGSPKNDEACRPLVEARMTELAL